MRSGQAMLEYVIAFAALLAVAGALSVLIAVAVRYAARTESLVSCEYP